MPDHWHGVVQVGDRDELSLVMNRVKSVMAKARNRVSGNRGRVWDRGFHDHALRREEDLVKIARYVVANPVRAGMVRSVRLYPYWDAVWIRDSQGSVAHRVGSHSRPQGGLLPS